MYWPSPGGPAVLQDAAPVAIATAAKANILLIVRNDAWRILNCINLLEIASFKWTKRLKNKFGYLENGAISWNADSVVVYSSTSHHSIGTLPDEHLSDDFSVGIPSEDHKGFGYLHFFSIPSGLRHVSLLHQNDPLSPLPAVRLERSIPIPGLFINQICILPNCSLILAKTFSKSSVGRTVDDETDIVDDAGATTTDSATTSATDKSSFSANASTVYICNFEIPASRQSISLEHLTLQSPIHSSFCRTSSSKDKPKSVHFSDSLKTDVAPMIHVQSMDSANAVNPSSPATDPAPNPDSLPLPVPARDSSESFSSIDTTSLIPLSLPQALRTTCHISYDPKFRASSWTTSAGDVFILAKPLSDLDATALEISDFNLIYAQEKYGKNLAIRSCINDRFSVCCILRSDGSVRVVSSESSVIKPDFCKALSSIDRPLEFSHCSWSPDSLCMLLHNNSTLVTLSFSGILSSVASITEPATQNSSDIVTTGADATKARSPAEGNTFAWSASGAIVFMISAKHSRILQFCFLKSAMAYSLCGGTGKLGCILNHQDLFLERPLVNPSAFAVQSDALLWSHAPLSAVYMAQHSPIRHVAVDPVGRYVAIAGARGFAFWSKYNSRWSYFINSMMESQFRIQGGMQIFHGFLIAAVSSVPSKEHEIRIYNLELPLDNNLIVMSENVPTPVVAMNIEARLLGTIDAELNICFYRISEVAQIVSIQEVFRAKIDAGWANISDCRYFSWLNVPQFIDQTVSPQSSANLEDVANIVILDGHQMQVWSCAFDDFIFNRGRSRRLMIGDNVEICSVIDANLFPTIFWLSGSKIILQSFDPSLEGGLLSSKESSALEYCLGFEGHPLSAVNSQGFVPTLMARNITYRQHPRGSFKYQQDNNHLSYAKEIARGIRSQIYLSHSLEIFLYQNLERAVAQPESDEEAVILQATIEFLKQFPQYLHVLNRCIRKTEYDVWKTLLPFIESPKSLFHTCLQTNRLRLAAAYLLVLDVKDVLNTENEDVFELFKKAYAGEDWDLCLELARFLYSVDESGNILYKALSVAKVPAVQTKGDFSH